MFNRGRLAKLVNPVRRLRTTGQSLTEYALIAVLLAVAVGTALAATGPVIGNVFSNTIFNVVNGTLTPYTPMNATDFYYDKIKVLNYQEPTKAGGNPNYGGGGGGSGGGGGNNLTATSVAATAFSFNQTKGAIQTVTQLALSATATGTATSTITPGGPTRTATATGTITPTASATGTPTITPTPQLLSLPIAEQFDTPTSVGDWQFTPGWGVGSGITRGGSGALTFAPNGATISSGNGATYRPFLNLTACGIQPTIQFWSRWYVKETSLQLVLEVANYTGSPPIWNAVWSYTQGQTSSPYMSGYDYNTAWRRYAVDLSSYACKPGKTLFRFRVIPTGPMVSNSLWYVDDVTMVDNKINDQTFTTASGGSSACDTGSLCNPKQVDLNAVNICDPTSYCTGTTKPASYYAGGDWSFTGALPLSTSDRNTWDAGGNNGAYQSNGDSLFELSQPMDLSSYLTTGSASSQPVIDFRTTYTIATGDTVTVEAWHPGMPNWQALTTTTPIAGTNTTWTRVVFDLSPMDQQLNVQIRFHLNSLGGIPQGGQNWGIYDLYIGPNGGRPGITNLGGLPFTDDFQNIGNWQPGAGWQIEAASTSLVPPLNYDFLTSYTPTPFVSAIDPAWTANFFHYHLGDPAAPSNFIANTNWKPPTTGLCKTAITATCVGTPAAAQTAATVQLDSTSTITTTNLGGFDPNDATVNPYWKTDAQADEDFVATYSRKYNVLVAGYYYFMLYSAGGSRVVIDGNYTTPPTPDMSLAFPFISDSSTSWDVNAKLHYYRVNLTGGSHTLEVDYFQPKNATVPAPFLQFEVAAPANVLHSNAAGSNYATGPTTNVTTNGYLTFSNVAGKDVYLTFNTRYVDGQTLLGFSNGDPMTVYASTDNGITWIPLNGRLINSITYPNYTKDVNSSPIDLPQNINGGTFPGNIANLNDQTSGGPTITYSTGQTWHTYYVDLSLVPALNMKSASQLMFKFELDASQSATPSKGWYLGRVQVFQSATAP